MSKVDELYQAVRNDQLDIVENILEQPGKTAGNLTRSTQCTKANLKIHTYMTGSRYCMYSIKSTCTNFMHVHVC